MMNQGTRFAKEAGFELFIVAEITLTIIVIFVCIILCAWAIVIGHS